MILPAPLRVRVFTGEVTVAVRRWKRPTVAGGTLRTPSGVLAIDSVERVRLTDLTAGVARAAGYPTRKALIASLAPTRNPLYLVRLHPGGPDPRVALRERAHISASERAELDARLDGFDQRSPRGPWTRDTLRTIAAQPAVRAPDLAAAAGQETRRYKADVRKLKELGLTESLEVGYRLSPRGGVSGPTLAPASAEP